VRTLPVEPLLRGHGPLLRELASTFTDDDRELLEPLLSGEERTIYEALSEPDRSVVGIALALHHGVRGVAGRTGLSKAMPPAADGGVGAGPRPWSTGGDPWYADLIDTALAAAGAPLRQGGRALDFGCSTGRVVRLLAARRPNVRWEGCDPDGDAIAWASDALPAITFSQQPPLAPTSYADDRFDAAYSLGMWTHFGAAAALAWLAELRRIVRPGGHLVLTAQGPGALTARPTALGYPAERRREIADALYRDGFAFVEAFGGSGAAGAAASDWGLAFFTPEWLLTQITPAWSLALYRARGVDDHQDLYVLRRER
jgi:SAM-dependent methyltransferase